MEIVATGEALLGNNNKHSMVKTMKGIFKTFALLCIGLATVACVEENLDPNNGGYDTTPGNEIQFSAAAAVNNGNIQTKTEYGDNNGQYIEINWTAGDKITIASPEADGTTIAHYDIDTTDESFVEDADGYDDATNGGHKAVVKKRGGVGLQWSESDTYTFYGMYPMLDKDEDEDFNGTSELIEGTNGAPAVLKGYLPVAQMPKAVKPDGSGNYEVIPDMRYAFMVAYDKYDTKATNEKISLQFKSLNTVLQFQIKAGIITGQTNNKIKINLLQLSAPDGTPICGYFKYNYPNSENSTGVGEFDNESATNNQTSASSFESVTLDLSQEDIILESNKYVDVTMFLLPLSNFSKDDIEKLSLKILYEIDGKPQTKIARLGVDIAASRKYYFKNMTMPDIKEEVNGSNWISALETNILVSQLSIPVAGHTFSKYYSGTDAQYQKQQVLEFPVLWNMGVRGFEFMTSLGSTSSNSINADNFKNEGFVCNGAEISATFNDGTSNKTLNFGNAFDYLVSQLNKEEYKNECLFIIATYKSYNGDGGMFPHYYLQHLDNFLTERAEILKDADGVSRLQVLNPQSTVYDLRGKVVILVKLIDDEYLQYTDKRNADIDFITEASSAIASMKNPVTIINNWGTSVDAWDRRYSGVARQKVFLKENVQYVEDALYCLSSDSDNYVEAVAPVGLDNFTESFQFSFSSNRGVGFHISDFTRVVPEDIEDTYFDLGKSDHVWWRNYRYLFVNWPSSIGQKTRMMERTMRASMRTRYVQTDSIYINSLSGYYVSEHHSQSFTPYADSFEYGDYSFSGFAKQGMGGDYAGLAVDMNTNLYDAFEAVRGTTQQGPLGFVIMDYIGANSQDFGNSDYYNATDEKVQKAVTASNELPGLILMNNFTFPLATLSTTPQQTSYDAKYVDGGEAISFE